MSIVQRDETNELVKVRYIGYDSSYNEWRPESDIINLSDEEDHVQEDSGNTSCSTYPGSSGQSALTTSMAVLNSFPPKHHSLYEELLFRIKSLLTCSRKGDSLCCIAMGFDTIHFEGLARRGVLCKTNRGQVYTLPTLTKLDDILGAQWYVRGINTAGDFCYVQPKTVKYELKFCKGKPDYQLLEDGTLQQYTYGIRHQLFFRFVRGDGISSQWYKTLDLCKK